MLKKKKFFFLNITKPSHKCILEWLRPIWLYLLVAPENLDCRYSLTFSAILDKLFLRACYYVPKTAVSGKIMKNIVRGI